MKKFDPYEVLGVPKDAGAADIKGAYRAAAKQTHPDAPGGDADAFGRVRRAELILLDPDKRKRFDDTGDADSNEPDNVRAGALQVIEAFIAPVIMEYVNSGMSAAKDPRHRDLLAEFGAKMTLEIQSFRDAVPKMRKIIEFLEDMEDRFDGGEDDNPLRRGMRNQIDRVKADIRSAERAIVTAPSVLARTAGPSWCPGTRAAGSLKYAAISG